MRGQPEGQLRIKQHGLGEHVLADDALSRMLALAMENAVHCVGYMIFQYVALICVMCQI